MLDRLSAEIVAELFRGHPVWRKWDLTREAILKRAIPCWIPLEDLTQFLNEIEGPVLTDTDVQARMDSMCEAGEEHYPREAEKEFCTKIYATEKARGTELAAIIQHIAERASLEQIRDYEERSERRRREIAENKLAAEALFHSGADCKWTALTNHDGLYCRLNGRVFQLVKGGDKKFHMFRLKALTDPGALVGRYTSRGDATSALETIAYA
jgi:hypothetical protein